MRFIFLGLFIIFVGIHLYASAKQDKPLRNRTKPFLLLSLLGFYLFSAEPVVAVVVLALLFSWLGDVLLIPKGNKWFTAGGIAFMISHAFFIAAYGREIEFDRIETGWILLLSAFFITVVAILFSRLKPHLPEKLFYPMAFYLLLNGAMNCFALFRLISDPTPRTALTAVGAILFFISDCSLFFVRFHKESRLKTHFPVMLTYSLGELLIVLGLL